MYLHKVYLHKVSPPRPATALAGLFWQASCAVDLANRLKFQAVTSVAFQFSLLSCITWHEIPDEILSRENAAGANDV
jgi:hypothetical protein